jgi:hypothetical protein
VHDADDTEGSCPKLARVNEVQVVGWACGRRDAVEARNGRDEATVARCLGHGTPHKSPVVTTDASFDRCTLLWVQWEAADLEGTGARRVDVDILIRDDDLHVSSSKRSSDMSLS